MNAQPLDMVQYESLLAFWRDAGVDACYLDEPVDHTIIRPMPTPAAVQKLAAIAPVRGTAGGTHVPSATAEAVALAASANTMEELAAAAARFEGCALKRMGAKSTLFGRGVEKADLLVIGDAPNAEDDARGTAYSSPVGQLLDRILAAGGVTDRAYLTQSVFWQPPGNRPPTAEEQAVCLPFIERAVQLLEPKAVMLIGAVAVKAILQSDESLLRLQGQWREWSPQGGPTLPVMTTFHPGFLLQQPLAKGAVWRDIQAVVARL